MKHLFLLLFSCVLCSFIHAQWSDKTNYFIDSNHMPVCTEVSTQQHSIVIKSYPDGGYFIFWEDNRNSANTKQDIYAQKFDKNGKRLWAVNGVPVVNSANDQHFYSSTNADYRNYSYAATDSAGGFYIGYLDDSINTYDYQRICVQHMRSNGSRVFGGAGYIVAQTSGTGNTYSYQQLIADGNGGFFIGFMRTSPDVDLLVYCYKEVNGKMNFFGGGQMDVNAYEMPRDACGNFDIAYRDATVIDYQIYPDLQKGCNAIMTLTQSGSGNNPYLTGFNKLVRIKKKSTVQTNNGTVVYKKDNVLTFYNVTYHTYIAQCGDAVGSAYILDGNGFLTISDLAYNSNYTKGAVLSTDGNINVDILTFNERSYINNSSTKWFTHLIIRSSEKFDSIPYAFTVFPYQPESYRGGPKPGQNKINYIYDTLLYNGSIYPYDFCLAATGNKLYATGIMYNNTTTEADVLLQQLQVVRKTSDSFAVQFTTNTHYGVVIGKDVSTGFGGSEIYFDNPRIATDSVGNALFYVREYGRSVRVSPIINATELAWGAMGRAIGTGAYNSNYYYPDNPFAVLGATNGTGVINWEDSRLYPTSNGLNIFMRHLDSLTKPNYYPVYKPVKLLPYQGGAANPVALVGSSKKFSLIEYFDFSTGFASPVVEILDKLNFGAISTNIYQNINTIRTYNSKPYLDRNFTIKPEINPANSASVTLRFFFTATEFNALKAAHSSVHSPADLAVIKQVGSAGNAPAAYSPVTGENKIAVQSWKAVAGGYYIQIAVTKCTNYTNYFIFPASVTLPLQQTQFFTKENLLMNADKLFIKNIYPIPVVDGTVHIETGSAAVTKMLVEIFSADGKIMYRQQLTYQPQSMRINNFANGIYTIRISAGKLVFNGSIVKSNSRDSR